MGQQPILSRFKLRGTESGLAMSHSQVDYKCQQITKHRIMFFRTSMYYHICIFYNTSYLCGNFSSIYLQYFLNSIYFKEGLHISLVFFVWEINQY